MEVTDMFKKIKGKFAVAALCAMSVGAPVATTIAVSQPTPVMAATYTKSSALRKAPAKYYIKTTYYKTSPKVYKWQVKPSYTVLNRFNGRG